MATVATDLMKEHINRNLLKHAAGMKMFCQCGTLLDYRETIILKGLVTCSACFQEEANKLLAATDDQGRANFRDWLGKVDFLSAYSWSFDDAGLLVKGRRVL